MRHRPELPPTFPIEVTKHGDLPGAEDYVNYKIGGLGRLAHRPLLSAHVKLTKYTDPALEKPVLAQANLDADGKTVRAQAAGPNTRETVDKLEARLRRQLERAAEHWEAKRGKGPSAEPHEWRHISEPTHRPDYFPRPEAQRKIVRHKAYTLATCTIDEAAFDMDMLDYDFHLFTEEGTGRDSVLYRDEPTGYRLAQLTPPQPSDLAAYQVPLTISPHTAPRLTTQQAVEQLNALGRPFLFFLDAGTGRGNILYRRYDGHYGLITPSTER
ncbi:ribosome hibernation promotion factor [Rhodococcus sp. AG1013]|uniref:ribosome hibernation promotion factor n=1 Tax=unclassified Rhodococcus (in: high G+C Gram-positive bacteria) TaxID=192944 RepID=UPI000E0B68E9|nr:HPF/RaiA family ribosome-associated protein [Rhodococcus sp. AG1013]RDI34078.1 ribosome-associated translation inhibitor RaiA [Rhodococcus sp. AG1013]